jgi:hypothetical protein
MKSISPIALAALWAVVMRVPAIAQQRPDTALLGKNLARFRRYKVYELQTAEYKTIRSQYLAWIDSRLKGGKSIAEMNLELKAAGLLSPERQAGVDIDRSRAGFLGEVGILPLLSRPDLLAVTFGIEAGSFCNFDETVVLYDRKTLQRIARVNAENVYSHGFSLRDFAVGEKADSHGGRLIGSAWVVTNCNSNWNGNVFRIDLARGQALKNILERPARSFFDDKLAVHLAGDTVTFNYTSGIRDPLVLLRDGIASYRVQRERATRLAPIAKSYGGFIDEWLDMDDAEAARWSTPDAARMHHRVAGKFGKDVFAWEHAADCPGSPLTREIAVRAYESKQITVFRISGTSAADMRMISVADQALPSCREFDIHTDSSSIINEPK